MVYSEKAEENREGAELCFHNAKYNAAASRYYYSLFLSAKVILAQSHFDYRGFLQESERKKKLTNAEKFFIVYTGGYAMDEYEKDLPLVRAAFEKLVAQFPNYLFKMDWVPEVGEFFILVNDSTLADTAEYEQLVDKLEAELFNRTYCRVIFTSHYFEATDRKGEYEINNFSQEVEADGEQVRSADAGVASPQAAKQGAF